ncbi:MAG: DUF3341 domain-containing protein [Cyclobacteriaceae bacterium]|nr:DUF3341 domain-containing protein [Cyclobacteriaceae bacterium]
MNTKIIGIFEEEKLLITALKKISEEKIDINEVFTPYPVHEVFNIMKLKSTIPITSFLYALLGLVVSYVFLYWTSVIDYPLIYGGKPLHSIPSFIIICFVSMISVSVLLSVVTFLIRTRLYPGKKPVIHDKRITDNAFIVLIDKKLGMSPKKITAINSILKDNGAIEIFEKHIEDK